MASRESDDEHEEEASPGSQLPFFTIGLNLGGDKGSSFRTENNPNDPLQRENYFEEKGTIDIRCDCIDVIHGLYSPRAQFFATFIILDLRFNSRKNARRVGSLHVTLGFACMKTGETGPEVAHIAPDRALSLIPTSQTEEVVTKGVIAVGGGQIVTATRAMGWRKIVSQNLANETIVIGSIDLVGRNYGKKSSVSWTLKENTTTKTGVPKYMRAAILLKRKDENPFQCVVKVKANADIKTGLGRMFGWLPRNDHLVLFDPNLPPTKHLEEYDLENLGAFNLDAASDLTFSTLLTTASKEKALKSS